jgi:hypothetical protein
MDIKDLLRQNGIFFLDGSGHHHARSGWIQLDCPFCRKGTNKYHLGVNLRYHYANCWACGQHSLVSLLAKLTNKPTQSLARAVKQLEHASTQRKRKQKRGEYRCPDEDRLRPASEAPFANVIKDRLHKSGYSVDDIIRLWNVQGLGFDATLRWRLFIPIIHEGERVSWTTRALQKDATLRYITANPQQESMNHKELLYGEDYCRGAIIVHEGPLDVWATGPGAAATLGLTYTPAQVARIAAYRRRIICFDSSADAQKRARRLAATLSVLHGETMVVKLETGDDTAEASYDELQDLRRLL